MSGMEVLLVFQAVVSTAPEIDLQSAALPGVNCGLLDEAFLAGDAVSPQNEKHTRKLLLAFLQLLSDVDKGALGEMLH